MMKAAARTACVFASFALVALSPEAGAQVNPNDKVLDFDTMFGIQAPFLRAAFPFCGVLGAGAPWSIDRGTGVLRANGDVDIHVQHLVLTNTGANPVATFGARVCCVTVDATGAAAEVTRDVVNAANAIPNQFPATVPGGDARIRGNVDLPTPCLGPVVFVTNGGTGAWFAVTGR